MSGQPGPAGPLGGSVVVAAVQLHARVSQFL
jgi:hypothetical protein